MQIRFLLAAYFHNALKSKKTYSYLLYLVYPNDNSYGRMAKLYMN